MATAFQPVVANLIGIRAPEPLLHVLGRVLGIHELERIHRALPALGERRPIADRLLEFLSIRCAVSDADLARIPRNGGVIVTVNHPYGILDGALIASVLSRVRQDVRILANPLLGVVPELQELVIAADPISGRAATRGNARGIRRAIDHLEHGGLLVVFPAGEVAHFRWRDRAVVEAEWHPGVARLARLADPEGRGPAIVPGYVEGANGSLFQLAGILHPRCRTALLGRELLNKRGRVVEARFGAPIAREKLLGIGSTREQVEYLRWRTDLLGRREAYKARTTTPLPRRKAGGQEAIAHPVAAPAVAADVEGLAPDRLLGQSGDLRVYVARAREIPNALLEIGRLREITFRAAGEGTGKARDLDEFDSGYLHLFVWNTTREEIVGAYRLAGTDAAPQLYTATLFHYDESFLRRLGPALELGRSFVRQEYQKGFAPLLLLWKGIGAFVARNPRYRVLFGPVSISNQYASVSRELMVGFLEKYAMLREWTGLARARNPFRRRAAASSPKAPLDVDDLSDIVADLEPDRAGVPVLLRQYLRLGGGLLGFNVDPEFSNALDGLILVDLIKTERKLLERYLGKAEAATFLEYQEGKYGTNESIGLDELGTEDHRGRHSPADALL